MLAGIVFGPATPGIVLVKQPEDLELLAALGLVLLLFHLGLEFSLDDLVGGGRKLLTAGAVYLLLNVGGGLEARRECVDLEHLVELDHTAPMAFGFALGWGTGEALVVAGAVGISSSAIVTKLLVELRRLDNPESRLILGIIVVEDIFLALYLAPLQPVLGDSEGLGEAALEFGRALGFLLLLAAVARWGGRVVGRLVDDDDDELLTVCFIGVAVVVAGVAEELGVSEAIGAFMAGLILAESAVHDRIERLVLPLRDAFAALFFFAFGLTIDPADVGSVALPVAAAVVVTFVLNVAAGLIAARMHDYRRVPAANIGLTILGRREFSLILATLAVAAGLDERIGPFIAGYVLVLALAGPLLASRSTTLARWIPARLVGETV